MKEPLSQTPCAGKGWFSVAFHISGLCCRVAEKSVAPRRLAWVKGCQQKKMKDKMFQNAEQRP
jgi:hypothetical protein